MTFYKGGAKKRRDANEKAIVEALEARGAFVFQLSGRGIPDLLVGYKGRWTPLEVKTKDGEATDAQQRAADAGAHVKTVRSEWEALKAVGVPE